MSLILKHYSIFFIAFALFVGILFSTAQVSATLPRLAPTSTPTPKPPPHVATLTELQTAQQIWMRSRHANTFDDGQGANTTCASCKAPRNWDPAAPAAQAAHDCAVCKREPGKPRPPLPGGVAVSQSEWQSITCDVCHQPVGNSYSTALAFWNQEMNTYEPINSTVELCNKCHVGQHGFDVIREQSVSPAHNDWDCTRCHGSHNAPVQCIDCHNITQGKGTDAHAQHPNIGCTACHDAGGLPIWQDPYATSRYYQKYMPMRNAHDLRSWPSHNLQTRVDCRRCHHPQGELQITVASNVRCDNQMCHSEGASFDWCPQFPRGQAPKVTSP